MVESSEIEKNEVRPHAGPQWEFFSSTADIVIYGGQAGGGKSWALVTDPLQWIEVRGFRAGIFRRTYPQLKGQGGVWDEAQDIYRAFGARMREGQELDATFPSGANVSFLHLQHEKTKYEYQGHQFAMLGFDELTHFTETQFFYMLSRNRSSCGVKPYVRASCNPDAGSWVAEFISWWIDQDIGTPVPERSGKLRYFLRDNGVCEWADSKEELLERFEEYTADDILSATFIPASLDDNPTLVARDPGYRAKLKALPRIERARLLGGNWKVSEGAQIEPEWIKHYTILDGNIRFAHIGHVFDIPMARMRRIATVDTAGTSKEKAAEARGDPPSWSVCGIWDALPCFVTVVDGSRIVLTELLFLRHVWRAQVGWNELKTQIPAVLQTWQVRKVYIENAHWGQPLRQEVKVCSVEMVGPVIPGMDDSSRGAKLERAVASGMLSAFENGKIFIPEEDTTWKRAFINEMTTWGGMPKETADQIDMVSYAAYVNRQQSAQWGGVIKHQAKAQRTVQ